MKAGKVKTTLSIIAVFSMLLSCKGTGTQECCESNQCENSVTDVMMARRSVRKYQDKAVDRDLLQQIALYGINAPNAMNAQQWAVRIVDSKDFLDGIGARYLEQNPGTLERDPNFKNPFRNAPVIIVVAGRNSIDCGLMGQNMMLAAESMGLGTCIMTGPNGFLKSQTDYYERLAFPSDYELQYIIAVGWPDEAPAAKERKQDVISFVD